MNRNVVIFINSRGLQSVSFVLALSWRSIVFLDKTIHKKNYIVAVISVGIISKIDIILMIKVKRIREITTFNSSFGSPHCTGTA